MRHGSLFGGIGGFDLAAQWMGWENVFQVEWDKWCQKILAKNFPDTLRFGDIVEFNKMLQDGEITTDTEGRRWKIDGNESKKTKNSDRQIRIYEENISEGREMGSKFRRYGYNKSVRNGGIHIEILTGGFPCQPFSHAGKRGGTDDSRYLWPEMLTTIRTLKPAFVVGENVAGLVSMENGKTLDTILSDLANEGYTTEQFIIPACAVGAWHRRDRIWIVAYNASIRWSWQEKNRKLAAQRLSKLCKRGREPISNMWHSEPSVGRVANGIPNRVDRLKGLGNAIVPQVAYEIFKTIEDAETHEDIYEAL